MTKINLKLSQKSEDGQKKVEENPAVDPATVEINLNEEHQQTEEEKKAEEERICIEEILASVGLDAGPGDEPPTPPPPTMDWGFMRRVCTAQIILSMISLGCIALTILLGGMRWYKFTATAWTMYLLITAYAGYSAGKRRCYSQTVAYCIMNAFQTLLHWGSMAWLLYMIYCLDNKAGFHRRRSSQPREDMVLFLELGESLALLGTILTGIFGMIACCKGFGRILAAQDRRIMSDLEYSRNAADGYEITPETYNDTIKEVPATVEVETETESEKPKEIEKENDTC